MKIVYKGLFLFDSIKPETYTYMCKCCQSILEFDITDFDAKCKARCPACGYIIRYKDRHMNAYDALRLRNTIQLHEDMEKLEKEREEAKKYYEKLLDSTQEIIHKIEETE